MSNGFLKGALVVSIVLNVVLLYQLNKNDDVAEPEAPAEQPVAPATATFESGVPYPLIRVVDGDTVIVGVEGTTEYVRLIGIDSPEPNDPGGPQCYALEATAHMQELARTGLVVLHFDDSQGTRDSYGRLLAYVELQDGTDVGEQMVADGFAREFTYDTPYERQATYKEAENAALTEERGLWGRNVCE